MKVRPTKLEDVPALKLVVDRTEIFPSETLSHMVRDFLSINGSKSVWLTAEEQGTAIGFCLASPETPTEATWNMLAIAVLPEKQGRGTGRAIVSALGKHLAEQPNRVLIANTSGTNGFAPIRKFYRKNGFTEGARIRDFWAAGDDKIVFWKAL